MLSRIRKKWIKPVSTLTLMAFFSQMLLLCCASIAQATTVESEIDSSDIPCHESIHTSELIQLKDDLPDSTSHCPQTEDNECCELQPSLAADVSLKERLDKIKSFFDSAALADSSVLSDSSNAAITHPPHKRFEKTRFSTPIYLSNCTFRE